MKYFILGIILLLIALLFIVNVVTIPTIDETTLNTDSSLYAGENETCITPHIRINCLEGLECVLITEEPNPQGICKKIN